MFFAKRPVTKNHSFWNLASRFFGHLCDLLNCCDFFILYKYNFSSNSVFGLFIQIKVCSRKAAITEKCKDFIFKALRYVKLKYKTFAFIASFASMIIIVYIRVLYLLIYSHYICCNILFTGILHLLGVNISVDKKKNKK